MAANSISSNKVFELIEDGVKLGFDLLCLSGGEPFEHTAIEDIVSYAKAKQLTVYIYSSGIVSSGSHIRRIYYEELLRLKELGLDKIIFDLPAVTESVYDELMGTKGCQKYVLESIRLSKLLGLCTELHFVPNKLNIGEIDYILSYAEAVKIDRVSFLRLICHGRASENQKRLSLSDREITDLKLKLAGYDSKMVRVGIPLSLRDDQYCDAISNKLCVKYDGQVVGCESFKYLKLFDGRQEVEPDSVYLKSLIDIYKHSDYLRISRELLKGCRNNDCEEACPIQGMLRR